MLESLLPKSETRESEVLVPVHAKKACLIILMVIVLKQLVPTLASPNEANITLSFSH